MMRDEMTVLNKFNQKKSEVVAGLPYMAAGAVAFIPTDVPVAGLLAGIVALKVFADKMKRIYQTKDQRYLKPLDDFIDGISIYDDYYEIDPQSAKKYALPKIVPFDCTDDDYNRAGDEVYLLFVDKVRQYNIGKNMEPIRAAYRALHDVVDMEIPTYHHDRNIVNYLKQNDKVTILKLSHILSIYRSIKMTHSNEMIIDMCNHAYEKIFDEKHPDRYFVLHQTETDRVINQQTRTSPLQTKMRGMFLASVSLTAIAVGALAYGLMTGESKTKQTIYLGGLAALVLGASQVQAVKNTYKEIRRFSDPQFIGEITRNQTVQENETNITFSEDIERLAEGERMRKSIMQYQKQLERLNNRSNATLGGFLYDEWSNFQKKPVNAVVWGLLKRGYSIEDMMRFYGVQNVSDSFIELNLLFNIVRNFKVSAENYKEGLKRHLYCIQKKFLHIQKEEQKYFKPDECLFSSDKHPVLKIKRKIIVPRSIKIHPAVKQELTRYHGN